MSTQTEYLPERDWPDAFDQADAYDACAECGANPWRAACALCVVRPGGSPIECSGTPGCLLDDITRVLANFGWRPATVVRVNIAERWSVSEPVVLCPTCAAKVWPPKPAPTGQQLELFGDDQ